MLHVRRAVQLVSLAFLIYLILNTAYPIETSIPLALFPRTSPLAAIATSLAARRIILLFAPAVLVLVTALLLGRSFCGWVCPMGTTIDIADRLLTRARKEKVGFGANPRIKYYLVAMLLVAAALGVQLVGWLDPLSLVTRAYAVVLHPYLYYVSNGLLHLLSGLNFLAEPTNSLRNFLNARVFSLQDPLIEQPFFVGHLLMLFTFVGILAVGVKYRRWWCRSMCPLGALLGGCARISLLRRRITDACIVCRRCEMVCKMEAITGEGTATRDPECIGCLLCQRECPTNAIAFWPRRRARAKYAPIDLSRRGLLAAGLGAVVAAPAMTLGTSRRLAEPPAIRPPGIGAEEEFLDRCTSCGQCMKVCLTNGLQPMQLEGGLRNLWTPKLVPRVGYCEYYCNMCGRVCPTGAIRSLPLDEKQNVVLGLAHVDRSRCIPWVAYQTISARRADVSDDEELSKLARWSDQYNCLVCEEHCPVPGKAIKFSRWDFGDGEHTINRPFVLPHVCVGCGICENKCPVRGEAAIVVTPQFQYVRAQLGQEKGTKDRPLHPGRLT